MGQIGMIEPVADVVFLAHQLDVSWMAGQLGTQSLEEETSVLHPYHSAQTGGTTHLGERFDGFGWEGLTIDVDES